MNILVRLPNWLGDVVMSTAFIHELNRFSSENTVDIIIKRELVGLVPYINGIDHAYEFSKQDCPFPGGLRRFGRKIADRSDYDVFFSLPDSFSSAFAGFFSGSKHRVGYKNEFRNFFLTHSYKKPGGLHRVHEYVNLITHYFDVDLENPVVRLREGSATGFPDLPSGKNLIFNLNSEAQSRRIPVKTGRKLINLIRENYDFNIILTGSTKDTGYIAELLKFIPKADRIYNFSGKTDLSGLIGILKSGDCMISADSGAAHLGNALGVKLIVLFGAGNESNTRPYNTDNLKIIRKPGLSCAPCTSNTCKFGDPPICLSELDTRFVLKALDELVKYD